MRHRRLLWGRKMFVWQFPRFFHPLLRLFTHIHLSSIGVWIVKIWCLVDDRVEIFWCVKVITGRLNMKLVFEIVRKFDVALKNTFVYKTMNWRITVAWKKYLHTRVVRSILIILLSVKTQYYYTNHLHFPDKLCFGQSHHHFQNQEWRL